VPRERVEAFARLFVPGTGQAQLGAAIAHALGDFLERVQVLAQQEHGLRRHAFHGQEFVGGLADPLGQHHQLAGGGDLGEERVCFTRVFAHATTRPRQDVETMHAGAGRVVDGCGPWLLCQTLLQDHSRSVGIGKARCGWRNQVGRRT